MGLGLSALTALLLLLPGIAFVFGLARLWSPSSRRSPFEQQFSAGLLIAIAAALVLHALGITLAQATHAMGWSHAPAPSYALILLAGDLKAAGAADALQSIESHSLRVAVYMVTIIAIGLQAGRYANRFLPAQMRAEWAALLEAPIGAGSAGGFAVLTTDVVHGDSVWLYSGYLDDFMVDREGRLDRVVFRGFAARRRFDDEAVAEPVDDPTFVPRERWTEIPGEIFVLQMAHARTVNVDYFFEDDDEVVEAEAPEAEGVRPTHA